jgi:hypothetical protein
LPLRTAPVSFSELPVVGGEYFLRLVGPPFSFSVVISSTVDFWVGLRIGRGQLTGAQKIIPGAFLIASAVVLLVVLPKSLNLQNGFLSRPTEEFFVALIVSASLIFWRLLKHCILSYGG